MFPEYLLSEVEHTPAGGFGYIICSLIHSTHTASLCAPDTPKIQSAGQPPPYPGKAPVPRTSRDALWSPRHRDSAEGFWWHRDTEAPHSQASKSHLVLWAFMTAPPAQPPPAAASHSPLKTAIDTAPTDATRLGSEAGGSPRSEFHAYFWVSVSQLWALGQRAPARPREQEGVAGPKRPRPRPGQHSSGAETLSQASPSRQGQEWEPGRPGWAVLGGPEVKHALRRCWAVGCVGPSSCSRTPSQLGPEWGRGQPGRAGSPSHMPQGVCASRTHIWASKWPLSAQALPHPGGPSCPLSWDAHPKPRSLCRPIPSFRFYGTASKASAAPNRVTRPQSSRSPPAGPPFPPSAGPGLAHSRPKALGLIQLSVESQGRSDEEIK